MENASLPPVQADSPLPGVVSLLSPVVASSTLPSEGMNSALPENTAMASPETSADYP